MMDSLKTIINQRINNLWINLIKGIIFFIFKRSIPRDLRKKYPKGGLSVSLSDKTSDKYIPPPPPAYV